MSFRSPDPTPEIIVWVENLAKQFVLHNQGAAILEVLRDVSLTLRSGDCLVLNGPSGAGKSSLLRCIYGNYKSDSGRIVVRHNGQPVDMVAATPREVLSVRRQTLGYVSQFLKVIPRVATIDVVAEPLRREGMEAGRARDNAATMLHRLNVPERLWKLAPATFSGGEQQRVNIARGFVSDYPVMLLDEPTSALDATNREEVIALVQEKLAAGAAVIGIFHDEDVRDRLATHLLNMAPLREAA
ncbi:MAG: phosphonate C-P lyase system protein PhnL [Rhodospirillaceae bacterium]|nr:phosphonate C-P lyase system protein PhnL [Rhodospirillaceae bacterium]